MRNRIAAALITLAATGGMAAVPVAMATATPAAAVASAAAPATFYQG